MIVLLTLEQVKNNLRVDHDFDDDYLNGLIAGAQAFVLGAIEVKTPPEDSRFEIACMFLVAHWYENRTGTANGMGEIPFGVTALIHQLRGLPRPDEVILDGV
ncbi:phage gp6-like head-tail connector protein [Bacillus thuringiensis]|nr:phage gp6-like head-tail connector protein [Bacillus thuringiensis]MRB49326.1 phage gp6-like head-tail connector protein [Bacillus thuringiensis]MRB55687.1 phage gp6-like head-tail connector protein [Bacillus thuringiensis]